MKWLIGIVVSLIILSNPQIVMMFTSAMSSMMEGFTSSLFRQNSSGHTLFSTIVILGLLGWLLSPKKTEKKEEKKEEKKS